MAIVLLDGFDASSAVGDDTLPAMQEYLTQKYPSSTDLAWGPYGTAGWGFGRALKWTSNNPILKVSVPKLNTYYVGFAVKKTNYSDGNGFQMYETGHLNFQLALRQGHIIYISAGGDVRPYIRFSGARHNRWVYIEVMVYTHATLGQYEVRVNGHTVGGETNIDTVNWNQGIDTFLFYNFGNSHLDDLYISDSGFVGPNKIEAIMPSGAGSSAVWTPSAGSNYQCVDEIPKNGDTDYVSAAAAATDLHACGDLANITGGIKGVQLNVDARTESDPTNIRTKCKSGSTTADGASKSVADTVNFDTFYEIEEVDPDTTAAWTASGVNGMEIGYEHLG